MVSTNFINVFSSFGRESKLKSELITCLNSEVKLVAKVWMQEQVRLGRSRLQCYLTIRELRHFKTEKILGDYLLG